MMINQSGIVRITKKLRIVGITHIPKKHTMQIVAIM